jgi:hypothetical protein
VVLTVSGVRAVRDSDEVDAEIDSVISRTHAQLGMLEQRARQLADVISEGGQQHDQ